MMRFALNNNPQNYIFIKTKTFIFAAFSNVRRIARRLLKRASDGEVCIIASAVHQAVLDDGVGLTGASVCDGMRSFI